jgi:ATP-binding cassette subfamily B protein
VTQETQMFSGTIRDNMLFVKPDATDEQILAAMEKASCANLVAYSQRGLDTVLGEGGKRVSGGEKQRLAIARALLREPRLLIFDEATSALDSITEEEITNTIREISSSGKQMTIFVLEKGHITEKGRHHELLEQKGLYYAMWRQQIGEREPPKRVKPEAPMDETQPAGPEADDINIVTNDPAL